MQNALNSLFGICCVANFENRPSSLFYYRGEIGTLAAFSRALVFRMTKLSVRDAEKFRKGLGGLRRQVSVRAQMGFHDFRR